MHAAFALGADYVLHRLHQPCDPRSRYVRARQAHARRSGHGRRGHGASGRHVRERRPGSGPQARHVFRSARSPSSTSCTAATPASEEIPSAERDRLEREVFLQPLDDVWAATALLEPARSGPPRASGGGSQVAHGAGLSVLCRPELPLGDRWRLDAALRLPDLVPVPAIDCSNSWAQGTCAGASRRPQCRVDIGLALLYGTCVLIRVGQLAHGGYRVPLRKCLTTPPTADVLRTALL